MDTHLIQLAKQYAAVIEAIEKTRNPVKLAILEERRVELHWEVMAALRANGIGFRDRRHATEIAIRMARKEV